MRLRLALRPATRLHSWCCFRLPGAAPRPCGLLERDARALAFSPRTRGSGRSRLERIRKTEVSSRLLPVAPFLRHHGIVRVVPAVALRAHSPDTTPRPSASAQSHACCAAADAVSWSKGETAGKLAGSSPALARKLEALRRGAAVALGGRGRGLRALAHRRRSRRARPGLAARAGNRRRKHRKGLNRRATRHHTRCTCKRWSSARHRIVFGAA